jgi:hypothetical protein
MCGRIDACRPLVLFVRIPLVPASPGNDLLPLLRRPGQARQPRCNTESVCPSGSQQRDAGPAIVIQTRSIVSPTVL